MVRLLLLLTAALTLAQCRRPTLVPQEDMIVRTDTQLRITYPRGEHPHITCRASPHQMEDGSVVDGHVIDGSVVDGHVIDGSVVDGWSRLQELDLMVRLEYTDSQSINCSLVPAVSASLEQNDLDPKALDPSRCLPPIEGGISASLYVCPDGWHLIETRCFLLANASGTWHEGQQFCSEAGGSLATVSSKFQQAILMLTLDEDTWIGFNDLEESSYVWVDGSLSTFTSWAEDKPSESSVLWMIKKQKKCVAMRRKYYYLWSNNHCDDVKQFLCSISAVPTTTTTSTTTTTTSTTTTTPTTTTTTTTSTTTSTPQSACEEGWQQYQSSCYYVSEEEVSWQSALEYCSLFGASLTSVTSEEEHLFLTNLVTENTWIGLSDQHTEGNYVWADNSAYDFSRWGYNEPSNSYSFLSLDDEDCVEMRWNIDYLWNDEPCDTDNRFICERPVNSNNYGYDTVY